MADVDKNTAVQWFQYFRDICSRWLIDNPIRLGGPGVVVEIDESVMAKRKYHRGHAVRERWVFGLYDTQQKIGHLKFVYDRTRETLLPIIEEIVLPGTEIHSDCWRSYLAIPAIPVIPNYIHKTVNHTENFVDPNSEACTNHVECFWKNAKQKIKLMCGTTDGMLPSHLDEFLWRQRNGKITFEIFNNLLTQISQYYPV